MLSQLTSVIPIHMKLSRHRVAEGLCASRVCALSLDNAGTDSGNRAKKTVTFSRQAPHVDRAKREECSTMCTSVPR